MQFTVKLAGTTPDTDAIRQALTDVDPSAMVDIEPNGQTLRIASALETDQLSTLITQAGHPVAEGDLDRVPSECCGGCGG